MKQVLIIDASPLFREFLKDKLVDQKIGVDIAFGPRDGFAKLLSVIPDLLIIDTHLANQSIMEFLEKKQSNPNSAPVPVFLTGPAIEKEEIAQLAVYNVHKYFTKPIKIDIFFESIGKMLKSSFPIDTTPCILETHVNDNIIFIEIAKGLNREKITLLKYKISELIEVNELTAPKIILMMTDITLSFIDGANLEFLLDNITADSKIKKKNVKVLTLDSFTKNLIKGHEEYTEMEVIENLSSAFNSLFRETETSNISELISEKILVPTADTAQGTVEMRFNSDTVSDGSRERDDDTALHIAVVDDDAVVRNVLTQSFTVINAVTEGFDSGSDFLTATQQRVFDLIILDIYMPGISGFDILKTLRDRQYTSPIIVYSMASHRDVVVQALGLGARSYLIKPLKPELVVKKALEILNSSM